MRVGGGKAKGSDFERQVCKELSLWVSNGTKQDLFWRSAMSGGRATVGKRKGLDLARQAGDISAVAPEGHVLTDNFFIECKFVKSLNLPRFFLLGEGELAGYWRAATREARNHGRSPVLIAKQNQLPAAIVARRGALDFGQLRVVNVLIDEIFCTVCLYKQVLEQPFIKVVRRA